MRPTQPGERRAGGRAGLEPRAAEPKARGSAALGAFRQLAPPFGRDGAYFGVSVVRGRQVVLRVGYVGDHGCMRARVRGF